MPICTAAHQAQALAQGAEQDEAGAAPVQHGHASPRMMTGVMTAGVTTRLLRLPLPLAQPSPALHESLQRRSWTMTTGITGDIAWEDDAARMMPR